MEKKQELIDRDTYKRIKKMDRKELCNYLVELYKNIYNDVATETKLMINMDAIRQEISQIKGIGEVRLNTIMDIIDKHSNPDSSKEE